MRTGTEHEYSINDASFRPLPINDVLIERLSGKVQNEFPLGEVVVSKELQKHVLELKPSPLPEDIPAMEHQLFTGLSMLDSELGGEYHFMGLGMHPTLTLDQTSVWDHDEGEIYKVYDRLFDLRQHGWLNIQALQINIEYTSPERLVSMYNRIRSLIPYLVAVTASSPFVEGRTTSLMDNRLAYYRQNQMKVPEISNGVIPERIGSVEDHAANQARMFDQMRRHSADILCKEWLDSRGVIVRPSRSCLEIKAIDEQECIHSDMAVTAFVTSLLRCKGLSLEEDDGALRELLDRAMRTATRDLKPELDGLYRASMKSATKVEKGYLPLIAKRIEGGSLAELMAQRLRGGSALNDIMAGAEGALTTNTPME